MTRIDKPEAELPLASKEPVDERARGVSDYILSADQEEQIEALRDILQDARLNGMGGHCFAMACAINNVLMNGQGQIVGSFNRAMNVRDNRLVGHVAVKLSDRYWDSDGVPKVLADIEHWGMLDPDDDEYHLSPQEADDFEIISFTQEEALMVVATSGDDIATFENSLLAAVTRTFEL